MKVHTYIAGVVSGTDTGAMGTAGVGAGVVADAGHEDVAVVGFCKTREGCLSRC